MALLIVMIIILVINLVILAKAIIKYNKFKKDSEDFKVADDHIFKQANPVITLKVNKLLSKLELDSLLLSNDTVIDNIEKQIAYSIADRMIELGLIKVDQEDLDNETIKFSSMLHVIGDGDESYNFS